MINTYIYTIIYRKACEASAWMCQLSTCVQVQQNDRAGSISEQQKPGPDWVAREETRKRRCSWKTCKWETMKRDETTFWSCLSGQKFGFIWNYSIAVSELEGFLSLKLCRGLIWSYDLVWKISPSLRSNPKSYKLQRLPRNPNSGEAESDVIGLDVFKRLVMTLQCHQHQWQPWLQGSLVGGLWHFSTSIACLEVVVLLCCQCKTWRNTWRLFCHARVATFAGYPLRPHRCERLWPSRYVACHKLWQSLNICMLRDLLMWRARKVWIKTCVARMSQIQRLGSQSVLCGFQTRSKDARDAGWWLYNNSKQGKEKHIWIHQDKPGPALSARLQSTAAQTSMLFHMFYWCLAAAGLHSTISLLSCQTSALE